MPFIRYRRENYTWLMTADPPLCGGSSSLARFRGCPDLDADGGCRCRFHINDLLDDLDKTGLQDLAGWFEADVEGDDMDALISEIKREADGRHLSQGQLELVAPWIRRFHELRGAGAGLTGQYADDLD